MCNNSRNLTNCMSRHAPGHVATTNNSSDKSTMCHVAAADEIGYGHMWYVARMVPTEGGKVHDQLCDKRYLWIVQVSHHIHHHRMTARVLRLIYFSRDQYGLTPCGLSFLTYKQYGNLVQIILLVIRTPLSFQKVWWYHPIIKQRPTMTKGTAVCRF